MSPGLPAQATLNDRIVTAPTLLAASMARTAKVWSPARSFGVTNGEAQAAKPEPSIEHSYWAGPGAEKVNVFLPEEIVAPSAGPPVIVTTSALVSTTNAATVASPALPTPSVALTAKV